MGLATKDDGWRINDVLVERAHSWLNRFRRLLVRWEILIWLCYTHHSE